MTIMRVQNLRFSAGIALAGSAQCREEELCKPLVLRLAPNAGLFTFVRSRLVFLRHAAPSGEVAYQICPQPAVLTLIRPRQGLHQPFIVLHHLTLHTRHRRGAEAAVDLLGLGDRIHTTPNRPTLMRRAMEAAGRRRVNALVTKGVRKAFSPALKIGLSGVQPDPIQAGGLHGEMHMRMTLRVRVRVCLERVQDHGVLRMGKFPCRNFACGCIANHRT